MIDSIPPIKNWSSSVDALLRELSPKISGAMLAEIAEADYGSDIDDHFNALKRIRDCEWDSTRRFEWYPQEVVELARWTEPDSEPGDRMRGHLIRAFACAVLLRAGADPVNNEYIIEENSSLAQLIKSALTLGGKLPEAAFRFIACRVHNGVFQDEEERPFFVFALVLLATTLKTVSDDEMTLLLNWLNDDEKRVRDSEYFLHTNNRRWRKWLLGLTDFDQKHDVWIDLAESLLLRRELPEFPENAAQLKQIGTALGLYYTD